MAKKDYNNELDKQKNPTSFSPSVVSTVFVAWYVGFVSAVVRMFRLNGVAIDVVPAVACVFDGPVSKKLEGAWAKGREGSPEMHCAAVAGDTADIDDSHDHNRNPPSTTCRAAELAASRK